MKKLSILNIKGGVGKTTSTINLASTLAEEGKKVLIVDIDAQSNSTMLFKAYDIDALSVSDILLDKNINVEDVIKGTDFDNIDVLPSNISLAFTEKKILLDVTRNQQNRLKKALEQVEDKYDYCLIDCPPSLNMITINALVASDEVIVPIKIDKFALDGLGYLLESINEIKNVPDKFKKWVIENQQKIEKARKRNTLPYFLRDNKSIIQNINTENSAKEITNRASLVGNEVQSLAESIAQKNNGFVTPVNYKSVSSIIRKVTTEGITPYDIKDAVRTTIIVPKSRIEQVLNELFGSEPFVRLKRQRPESFMGYSGNIVNIKTSGGLTAEIQVNTERMIYAKEKPEDAKRILGEKRWKEIQEQTGMEGGLGHKYYEEWRVLDKADKKAQKIAEKSIEYYSHFQ